MSRLSLLGLLLALNSLGCSTAEVSGDAPASPSAAVASASPVSDRSPANSTSGSAGGASASAAVGDQEPVQPRIQLPPGKIDENAPLREQLEVATDQHFQRETRIAIEPGRDRLRQNSPTPQQVAEYEAKLRAVKAPQDRPVSGQSDAPMYDPSGMTQVR